MTDLIMAERITYYAFTRGGAGIGAATGLIRRRVTPEGRTDESLGRDLRWQPSSALFEWEMSDISARKLVEISEAEAAELMERFRAEWGEPG
jgi:hypothetical protein